MQIVTGNIDRDPAGVLASLIAASAAANLIDDQTGRTGPILDCSDGGPGGSSDGNLVIVTCVQRHGLNPGDEVVIVGTGDYDGPHQADPTGSDTAFYLNDVAFTEPTSGGSWS